jgi:hypothetical protein
MRDAFLACLGGAVAAAYKSGGTALLPGIAACTGKITYDHYRCVAKVGCQEEGHVCVADGYCCPVAQACGTPHPNSCCGSGATCCGGKDCCPTGVGFTCLNEGAGPCCYGGQTVCGGKCCATDRCHECRNGSCVDLCDGLNQYCGAGNVCKECDPRTGCGG